MADKNAMIAELIAMQKKFQDYESANGVKPEEYFVPKEGEELFGYREKYNELAMALVDVAHAEKGSVR